METVGFFDMVSSAGWVETGSVSGKKTLMNKPGQGRRHGHKYYSRVWKHTSTWRCARPLAHVHPQSHTRKMGRGYVGLGAGRMWWDGASLPEAASLSAVLAEHGSSSLDVVRGA